MNITQHPAKPVCDICANPARLVAIEPHPDLHGSELLTFECLICTNVFAVVVPDEAVPDATVTASALRKRA